MNAPITITPSLLPLRDWREYRGLAVTRSDIAVLVWAVVAEFCHDNVSLTVSTMQGAQLWQPCESYIRDHAEEAEKQTIEYGRMRTVGTVIMEVLTDLELADDYLRIKRNEQHMAFEDGEN